MTKIKMKNIFIIGSLFYFFINEIMIAVSDLHNITILDVHGDEVEEICDDYKLEEVGKNNNTVREIDISKRNCHVHNMKFFIGCCFGQLTTHNLTNVNLSADIIFPRSASWKLLRYDVGCFFDYHVDKQLENNHTHTALIFPPFNNFEGGDLILTDDIDEDKCIIRTVIKTDKFSKSNNWTFVCFPINLYHKVQHVTNGQRFVFKSELYTNINTSIDINKTPYKSFGLSD